MAVINQVGNALTGSTGTGAFVGENTPTLITPVLGVATGTSFNTITGVATQAEQETSTSIVQAVTPGRQQYHPSAAKAWAKFGVSGNILASYNVTSITDNGAGLAQVNFTTAFSSENYSGNVTLESTGLFAPLGFILNAGFVAGAAAVVCVDSTTGVPTDPTTWSTVFFGDQ